MSGILLCAIFSVFTFQLEILKLERKINKITIY